MNQEERIAQLEAQLAAVEADKPKLKIYFGQKRNVCVGGPALGQRFPVTLYAPSWLLVLDHAEEIRAFIEENRESLSWGN